MTIHDVKTAFRVRQWTKNILVFAATIFARRFHDPSALVLVASAYILLCLLSSAVYIMNDILDIERDRSHPIKRKRPFAAGNISAGTGWIMAVALAAVSLGAAFMLDTAFGAVLVGYVVLQLVYSLAAKNVVILDVFFISAGFMLRVIAGAVVIHVPISNWLLVCTMLLALFLALSKRRHELTLLEGDADGHRAILREYSPYLLDQMIGVVAAATLVSYTIFSLSDETTAKFGTHGMLMTVPFVLYGIFRYLYLVHHKNAGGQPEEILLSDTPLRLAILGYGITAIIAIYT